ncbi:MAG: hypothetical protein AAF721_39585, partial [Myxococcota bacterium]
MVACAITSPESHEFGDGTGGGGASSGDAAEAADPADDDDGLKLDVGDGTAGAGAGDEAGHDPCVDGEDGGEPGYEFSVIWIANSRQGTVSKIDTITATETARYFTGPPIDGLDPEVAYRDHDPSRTSVNLRGDVVVGNRGTYAPSSSFTKITGDDEACPDRNGDGEIRTSQGPLDILPWGEDDCVEWNYAVESNNARAVAWDAGEQSCEGNQDAHVWVGYRAWNDAVHIDLVDGETGEKIDGAVVTDPAFANGGYGIYGGAADKDGNFWGVNTGLVFVDRQTFEWRLADGAGYGFALDQDGDPWGDWGSGRVGHTDAASGTLVDIYEGAQGGYDRGIAIDTEQQLWMVTNGF